MDDAGVSPIQSCGVFDGVVVVVVVGFVAAVALPSMLRAVAVNFLLAVAIQSLSFESSASRYSCLSCVSSSPGKKSRAMIWDSASV